MVPVSGLACMVPVSELARMVPVSGLGRNVPVIPAKLVPDPDRGGGIQT